MSHIETHYEERSWEEEVCDNCGHDKLTIDEYAIMRAAAIK